MSSSGEERSLDDGRLRFLDRTLTAGTVVFWVLVLYWAFTQAMPRARYGILFLGGILAVYVLDELIDSLADDDWIDVSLLLACGLVMLTATVYLYVNFEEIYTVRQGWAFDHEYMLAQLVVGTLVYLTWREFGNVFLVLVGGAILYAYFGFVVPGIFGHGGVPVAHILQQLVTDMAGFYGTLTQLTAAWIAPFLLYAGLLFGYGAFDLILRTAIRSARYIESGVAQTAVLASAVIGSINGSYTANAGMSGSFTIPTMKESGLSSRTAAGVEAVASTSGQVLPPVMGASAFVMASFLGIQYIDVVIAGLIPAAILVTCIVIGVHYTAIQDTGEQELEFDEHFDERMTGRDKLVEGVRFGVPLVILIYALGVLQWTVMSSALVTIVAMMVLGIGMPLLRAWYNDGSGALGGEIRTQLANTVDGFRRGAIILAPIAIILAAINGVVDLFMVTGVPSALALMLIDLSGGVLIVAVLLAMAVCIVMGVGMPTVAAYVIVSILIAPTLIGDFGVPELAAHFMVFYAAVMAGITPPVATAAIITAGIAEADFWQTCGKAIKMAAPLFVLPIAFIYHPELVPETVGLTSLFAGLLTLIGGIALIYGLNYPFDAHRGVTIPVRLGLIGLGLVVMVHPMRTVQVGGVVVFACVFLAEKTLVRGWGWPVPSRIRR